MISLNKYYEKKKHKIFPEITDWTKDYNEKRFNNNVKDMSYNEWFWFHHTAYKIVYYGSETIFAIFFLAIAQLFHKIGITILTYIWLALAGFMIYRLIIKIKDYKQIKNINFYDVFLREQKDYITIPKQIK